MSDPAYRPSHSTIVRATIWKLWETGLVENVVVSVGTMPMASENSRWASIAARSALAKVSMKRLWYCWSSRLLIAVVRNWLGEG